MDFSASDFASRCAQLSGDNPLRALTEVIARVPGGINLGQGVCDLGTPQPLVAGAVDSIAGGVDRQTYTHYSGLPELKEAIRDKLRLFNGLAVGADQVLVAAGSSGAFAAASLALFEPGDEVILFAPICLLYGVLVGPDDRQIGTFSGTRTARSLSGTCTFTSGDTGTWRWTGDPPD